LAGYPGLFSLAQIAQLLKRGPQPVQVCLTKLGQPGQPSHEINCYHAYYRDGQYSEQVKIPVNDRGKGFIPAER
jgi:hypothetical protein